MESRKPFSSLHEDYAVTYLRRKMVPFQQLMDTLGNFDQYEVEYIEDTLKTIGSRLRLISRSLNSNN